MSEPDEKALVAQILSSYLSNNTVAPADLPSVIESVKKAFSGGSDMTLSPSGMMTGARRGLDPGVLSGRAFRGRGKLGGGRPAKRH